MDISCDILDNSGPVQEFESLSTGFIFRGFIEPDVSLKTVSLTSFFLESSGFCFLDENIWLNCLIFLFTDVLKQ